MVQVKVVALKGLVYLIEAPIIAFITIVFLLLVLVHWIDDEWISER